jgi:hypothetical protein
MSSDSTFATLINRHPVLRTAALTSIPLILDQGCLGELGRTAQNLTWRVMPGALVEFVPFEGSIAGAQGREG